MDATITFRFKDAEHKGHLVASKEIYPHFYWCFIEDPELTRELGDCIGFKDQGDGVLEPTEMYPKKYEELITTIKREIEDFIRRNDI